MKKIKTFYMQFAEYLVEVEGDRVVRLRVGYADNTFEVYGEADERVVEIAQHMLKKKHGVNFAYKFNGSMEEV